MQFILKQRMHFQQTGESHMNPQITSPGLLNSVELELKKDFIKRLNSKLPLLFTILFSLFLCICPLRSWRHVCNFVIIDCNSNWLGHANCLDCLGINFKVERLSPVIGMSKPQSIFKTQRVSAIMVMFVSGHNFAYPEFIYIRSISTNFNHI